MIFLNVTIVSEVIVSFFEIALRTFDNIKLKGTEELKK